MTKLIWDQIGEKVYETGVYQGVLYSSSGNGVVWNGLTSVEEDQSDLKQTPYYLDGVKYFNERSTSDFSGTLKAIYYPDEFLEFDGYQSSAPGLLLDGQPVRSLFGLSYRTLIGDDIQGTALGYKIHLLYNLTATPSNKNYATNSKSATALEFSWKITGIPEVTPGYRASAHAVIDSRKIEPWKLVYVENILYGSDEVTARLPSMAELMTFIYTGLYSIVDNGNGTFTVTGPDDIVYYIDEDMFEIASPAVAMIDEFTYTISDATSSHDTDIFDGESGDFDDGTI